MLNFSKDNFLNEQDKINLQDKTDFDIFMSILRDSQTQEFDSIRENVYSVLYLIFQNYDITFGDTAIFLRSLTTPGEGGCIENANYEEFKDILLSMFCMKHSANDVQQYNPKGDMARRIAEKLKKARQKIAQQKSEKDKISLYANQVSILAVGENKDMNALLNYTVYQLSDEFQRYQLKIAFDMNMQVRLAGAKDVKEVDNWMKDLHSESI